MVTPDTSDKDRLYYKTTLCSEDLYQKNLPPSSPTLLLHTIYNTILYYIKKKCELGNFIFEDSSQHASILRKG
jgi:hypothetical protein